MNRLRIKRKLSRLICYICRFRPFCWNSIRIKIVNTSIHYRFKSQFNDIRAIVHTHNIPPNAISFIWVLSRVIAMWENRRLVLFRYILYIMVKSIR